MPKRSILIVAGIILLTILGLGLLRMMQGANVAKVNGVPISKSELDEQLEKKAGRQVLDQMITDMLVLQEADRQGIEVSEQEVNDRLNQLKAQYPDEATFNQNLEANHITQDEAKQQLKIKILTEKLITASSQVTEEDTRNYYDENKDTLFGGRTYEEEKENIKMTLDQQKKYEANQSWTANLRNSADVEILLFK